MRRQQMIDAYLYACEVELQAFKPGNVSVYSDGHDMTVEDFRVSARASAKPVSDPRLSLGEKIYHAVKATREAVGCNTNLGIILLAAPLMQAVSVRRSGQALREALANVLDNTTQRDAEWVFQAITLAAPGGLGDSAQQDVKKTASVTLTEAMKMAAERDRIAMQYATCYKDVFDFAILEYNRAFNWFDDSAWAAVSVFTNLLERYPDSHIERKYGKEHTIWVEGKINAVNRALSTAKNPERLLPMLHDVDKAFKAKGLNPGTTADMTVTTVLTVCLEQSIGDDPQSVS